MHRVDIPAKSMQNMRMATDIKKLVGNLLEFYDFKNKTVVSVGAGGGQLIEYGRPAKKVIAVDNSIEALDKLKESLAKSDLGDKFTLVHSDFYQCDQKGDVVVFEFCLHEMPDPATAVVHARKLAGDVLALDHLPESPWIYYGTEEEKAVGSWRALRSLPLRKFQKYDAVQFFKDYEELRQKVGVMGEEAIRRIRSFAGRTDFIIPMTYGFALI
jgi:SAM-dependent methyltransferase